MIFEVEYANKKIHAIIFGAQVKLTAKDSITFRLRNEKEENLCAQLTLSRKILKGDGLSFLRFLKSSEESSVTIGTGFRW